MRCPQRVLQRLFSTEKSGAAGTWITWVVGFLIQNFRDTESRYRLTMLLMVSSVVALVATVRDVGPGEELHDRGVAWMYLFTASLPHRSTARPPRGS